MNRPSRVTGIGPVARRFRLASAAVGVAMVLVACSGSDSAGPASESSVPEDASPTSVETTTTSTSTTTTIAPTTTNPPPVVNTVSTGSSEPAPETSAPDSLPAPTDTMFDPATPEGEVEQVALADVAAFVVCLEQLPRCDVDAAIRYSALDYAEGTVDLVGGWNEAGYEARRTDDYNYRVDEIAEFSEDGTEAVVLLCVWGATELYLPATATAPETIVDGQFTSTKERVLVRRIDDRWVVTALDVDEEAVGESSNLCV